jgi:hypothetical protein
MVMNSAKVKIRKQRSWIISIYYPTVRLERLRTLAKNFSDESNAPGTPATTTTTTTAAAAATAYTLNIFGDIEILGPTAAYNSSRRPFNRPKCERI